MIWRNKFCSQRIEIVCTSKCRWEIRPLSHPYSTIGAHSLFSEIDLLNWDIRPNGIIKIGWTRMFIEHWNEIVVSRFSFCQLVEMHFSIGRYTAVDLKKLDKRRTRNNEWNINESPKSDRNLTEFWPYYLCPLGRYQWHMWNFHTNMLPVVKPSVPKWTFESDMQNKIKGPICLGKQRTPL